MEWAHDHRSKISPVRDGLKMGVEMLSVRWNDLKGLYKMPVLVPETLVKSASVPISE